MFNYLVKEAKYLKDYKLWISFADGMNGEIDLLQKVKNKDGVFKPLHDVNYFKNFAIVGNTIAWENGADIAPESLYELFIKQNKK
ncbi:MAG: DUF2442 domain-containing protein [Rickettsiales bacterium]|nr:DUF2442 domain-containing protein [Rickettsiales bacterium]